MSIRVVQPDEGCPHTHTRGGTTWGCCRKRHDGDQHMMVVIA